MKTTVELPDDLLNQAKRAAREDATTLRQLLIQGLRLVLSRRADTRAFRLPDKSVDGDGVHPDFTEGSWELPFDSSYSGRGS